MKKAFWVMLLWLMTSSVFLDASEELHASGHRVWNHVAFMCGMICALRAGRESLKLYPRSK